MYSVRAGESIAVGDRVVRVVGRLDRDDPAQPYAMTATSVVWATGPCGEDPVRLADGVDDIFTVAAWPDVVLGCAGDVPTMETLAAVEILRGFFPDLRIRVVNVVDLMRLQDDR